MRRKSLRRRKIEAITNLVGTIILLLALIKFGFWVINGAEKENARSTPSYMQSVKWGGGGLPASKNKKQKNKKTLTK